MVYIRSGKKTRIKCPHCATHKHVVPSALGNTTSHDAFLFRTYLCTKCNRRFRVEIGRKEAEEQQAA